MIQSFAEKETEKVWRGERSRRLPFDIQEIALRKLRLLHAAKSVADMRVPPGNRLEALKGKRKGQWSIRVNDPWRICFHWSANQGGPSNVEIVDYH
jgi:proteic killer suppression protein